MKELDPLKEMFAQYRPPMGDADMYMEQLQRRMRAAEALKRHAEQQRRLYRRRMVVAFVSGTILGAAMIVYMLLRPMAQPQPDASHLTLWLHSLRPLATAATVAVVSSGLALLCTLQPSGKDFSRSTP